MASSASTQLPLMTLPSNTMTPYLRAHVEVTDDVLRWDAWWTVLGFLPVRRDRLALPLADLAETRSRVGFHWDRLIVGVALVAAALVWVRGWLWIPVMAAAVLLLVMAPTAQLDLAGTDGQSHRLSICIRHRVDVDLLAVALDILTGRRPARTRPRSSRVRPPGPQPLTDPNPLTG